MSSGDPFDEYEDAEQLTVHEVTVQADPAKPELTYPMGYDLSPEGLLWAPAGDGRGGKPPRLWLASGFEVTAMARDGDGEDWSIVLDFKDLDGRHKREIIGRDELAGDAVEVRRRFMRRGLSLTSTRAGRERLQVFLGSVRTAARARLVYAAGWQGESYVLPHRTIGPASAEPVLFRGRTGGANHAEAGSYAVW